MMMTIEWNNDLCTTPLGCHKCLNACPQGVFTIYPRQGRGPGQEPGDWAIKPSFQSLCTGCNVCVDLCPEKALTVTVLQESPA
jgi:NAD-dependent dihydropyrimidine dehydrogenase PreA subunit